MTPLLIQDLAVVLLISAVAAVVCQRLRQPKLIGYILAGLIIGPHTPPFAFIRDEETIRTLGELGVIFLMFSLGLDFNLRKLRKVGAAAVVTAVLDVSVMVWLGYLLGRWMGWSPMESLFLGAIVCDSSSTILARILNELGLMREGFAHLALGTTIIEDILTVVLIAVLTGMALTGTVQPGVVALGIWQVVLFMGVGIVVGLLVIPRLLDYVHKLRSDELLVVTLVGLCFGVVLLAAAMDVSMALAAVLIGAIASESRALNRITHLVAPLRDVFSAVFFVTIGLRLDPSVVMQYGTESVLVILLVIAGKFVANSVGVLLTGHSLETMVRVGSGMAQVGEFAFIISALAITLGLAREELYQIGVVAATATTLLNPYFIRGAGHLVERLEQRQLWQRWGQRVGFYSQWMERVGQHSGNSAVRAIVRRSLAIVGINVLLIAGVFGFAGYLANVAMEMDYFPFIPVRVYAVLLWLGAAVFSLPLYVVTLRKLGALAMILAEAAFPSGVRGEWVQPIRVFLWRAITLASGAGLVLLTFILSSTLLPSTGAFVILGLTTVVFAFRARSSLSRLYARAEGTIQGMIREPRRLTASLGAANVADMEIALIPLSDSVSVGRTLRNLNVRSRSGATVVAVERRGERITNPDPDLQFEAGDRLFLLGSREEILAARTLLTSK